MKTFCTTTLSLLATGNAVENTAPVISLSLDAYTSTHQGHGLDSEDRSLCGNDAAALAARNTDAATAPECEQNVMGYGLTPRYNEAKARPVCVCLIESPPVC